MVRSTQLRLLAAALGLSASGASTALAQTSWDAGADLAANEANPLTELSNPNATVPEWSYGHRQGALGPGMTLYAQHENDPNFQGWREPNSCCGPLSAVLVNVSGGGITVADGVINPGEMLIHPDSNAGDTHSVVRFTVSTTGPYDVAALWEDVDDCCGDGAGVDVHVVHNGVSLFSDLISREADAAPTSTSYAASSLALTAGDTLEFVIGHNTALFGDSTRFNATLELVPEPSALALLAVGGLAAACRRRR